MKPSSILLIIVAIALFYFFTSSQYAEVKTLQASADEYKAVLENVSRIAETRDQLLKSYEALPKVAIDQLDKALPDYVDTVGLAVDLDNIASRYGISVRNIRVQNGADNARVINSPGINSTGGLNKANVTFSFISDYANFLKFVADIERSLRIMDVKSVSFNATASATDATRNLYEHAFIVETYWHK